MKWPRWCCYLFINRHVTNQCIENNFFSWKKYRIQTLNSAVNKCLLYYSSAVMKMSSRQKIIFSCRMSFCCVWTYPCDKLLRVMSCTLFPAHADTVDTVAPSVTLSPFCKTLERACGVVQFDVLRLKTQHITSYSPLENIVWRNVHSCSVLTLLYLFELVTCTLLQHWPI